MRGIWTALTAAGAAALTLAACGSEHATSGATRTGPQSASAPVSASEEPSGAPTPSGTVPWVDRPVAAPGPSPTPPLRLDAPPCSSGDVVGQVVGFGAGLGNLNLRVAFTVRAGHRCSFVGYPTVSQIGDDISIRSLTVGHGSYFGDPGPPAAATGGEVGAVNISSTRLCGPDGGITQESYTGLRIGLPGGGFFDAYPKGGYPRCRISVSQLGVPADAVPGHQEESPLTATIVAPSTVHPGEVLAFAVTLANPTDRAYSLSPCPTYGMYVGTFTSAHSTVTEQHEQLSCDSVRAIGAHQAITYEMRLPIRTDQQSGPAKFSWQFDDYGAGPGASAALTIVSG